MDKITFNGITIELNNKNMLDSIIMLFCNEKIRQNDIVSNIAGLQRSLDGKFSELNTILEAITKSIPNISKTEFEEIKTKVNKIDKEVPRINEMVSKHTEILNDNATERKRNESEKQKRYDEFITGFEAIQQEILSFGYEEVMKLLSDYFYSRLKNEETKDMIDQIKQKKDFDFGNVIRRINDLIEYKQKAIEEDGGNPLHFFVINPVKEDPYDARLHNNIDMYFNPQPGRRTVIKETIVIGIKFPEDLEFKVKTIKAAVTCSSVLAFR